MSLFRKSFTIPQSEFFLLIYNVYSTIKRYDYVMFPHIVDDNIMLLKIKCQGAIVNNLINHNKTMHSSDFKLLINTEMTIETDGDLYPELSQNKSVAVLILIMGSQFYVYAKKRCIMTLVYKSLQNIHWWVGRTPVFFNFHIRVILGLEDFGLHFTIFDAIKHIFYRT